MAQSLIYKAAPRRGVNMVGALGGIGGMRIVVSAHVPDDTFIVSQRTFDSIKAALPEARQDNNESAPQPTTPQGMPPGEPAAPVA